jgi:hypothetical protein
MIVYKIDGTELKMLLEEIGFDEIHTLRVAVDGGGVKFKINQSTWSPPLGGEDQ